MDNPQYTLDTPDELTFERAFYIGSYLTAILYGMHVSIFFLTNYFFLASPNWRKESAFYIAYGTVMLLLWTIAHSCNAIFGQYVWIDHRDVVGGPAEYLGENMTAWYNTLGTVAGICMNFMADGLLLYRCFVIWGSSYIIIAFPVVVYFSAMSMAILLIYQSAIPAGTGFFSGSSISFGLPYTVLTVGLNVITTIAICVRLLFVRRKVRAILGEQHCQTYTGVVACLLESALPFTTLGIIYAIAYGRNSPYAFALLQVWADFCAISPQLIILRVALGKAWSKQTVATVSVLVFDHRRAVVDTEKAQYRHDTELDIGLPQELSRTTDLTSSATNSTSSTKDLARGIAI
ncbi:hypothetical protein MIND_00446200 [Mycena indigotica]|uniref:Uncharacterized protein n=1 Tax=Mycena indigotica TaxID=2126181 RepID=A0A8H6WBP3_9AGAR|nr:uncharacterized protein MIND_00446200 [Mycena indigotica]KAF7306549.1 hypothetical protein MIND_00446200 [Mycena indigotica]